ncbi:MAG: hypothetical protein IT518_19185 [Burkholderiales bacterium]|nr:hypothetical protein [Burkholderiales bacterium]
MAHLIQDIGQPQHSRNDSHGSGSLFEKVVDELRGDNMLNLIGHSPVVVARPDDLWHTGDQRGLADYSNRGFVSSGTNFKGTPPNILPNPLYPLPGSVGAVAKSSQITHPDLLGPLSATQLLDGEIWFIQTPVRDGYAGGQVTVNPRTSSYSLFDEDLQVRGREMPYTVNRFTMLEAEKLLTPRIVGYTAGMFDYFFRGSLEIDLPGAGVFALVDTHPQVCGAPCGFREVHLRVRNTTPADAMGAGQLRLVARYRLNACYRSDLSGEDGGPAFTGNGCRSPEEYVAVSDPTSVAGVPPSFGGSIPFFFAGATPIPINASDLSLQVVFRGVLGQESDAVAVSTLDVSEPNFVAVGNLTDYAYEQSDQRFHQVPYRATTRTVLLDTVSFGFQDPATAPALATLSALDGGQHAQFAFISKREPRRYWLRVQSQELYPAHDNLAFPIEEFFRDDDDPGATYARTCPVRAERGQYRQFSNYYAQAAHGSAGARSLVLGSAAQRTSRGILAKYADDCYAQVAPGSGGLADFSYLTPPFSPTNARQWTFNFAGD